MRIQVVFFVLILGMVGLEGKVGLGIDVLEAEGFKVLEGKRVGLLTHPAGVNGRGESTVDVLMRAKHVKLRALFGPEHGVYGNVKAEKFIGNERDERTGLPVYSLYGKTRKPMPWMLRDIDVMVIDLQDVGVRCYTYVSCMLYAMESCFEHGIEVVVLDRPNPLGGDVVDGPVMDFRWLSYVGSFLVPHVHGLTIGELALIGKKQLGWLGERGKLKVVGMKGWKRWMIWSDTGLDWIATSPYIRDFQTVMGYPMTGLGCQIGGFKHGLNSKYPFRMLSYEGKSAEEIKQVLEKRGIPGISFKVVDYHDGVKGKKEGVYVSIDNHKIWKPAQLNFHLMQLAAEWSEKNPFKGLDMNEMVLFNKHVGSDEWWIALSEKGAKVNLNKFLRRWEKQCYDFKGWSRGYWLYE